MFGGTVFLLNSILNAWTWVMQALTAMVSTILYCGTSGCFINLPAWLLETFAFDAHKTSWGLPRFPCWASILKPTRPILDAFTQSAIQTSWLLPVPQVTPWLCFLFLHTYTFFFFGHAVCRARSCSSLTGDQICAPAVEAQSPNHWTARESPAHIRFWDTLFMTSPSTALSSLRY